MIPTMTCQYEPPVLTAEIVCFDQAKEIAVAALWEKSDRFRPPAFVEGYGVLPGKNETDETIMRGMIASS